MRHAFTLIELWSAATCRRFESGAMAPHSKKAFTLIELLVVVTIIVVLLALLTPALDKAIEQAERAVCASNQKAINTGALTYALSNKQTLVICRGRSVEATFVTPTDNTEYQGKAGDNTVDWLKALASVGLAASSPTTRPIGVLGVANPTTTVPLHIPGKIWNCPSTKYTGYWDAGWRQYWNSYQYYGGIDLWYSGLDSPDTYRPSRSPRRINRSDGGWVLTADRSILFHKTDWNNGGFDGYWGDNPNHKSAERKGPSGNNQSYMDGSVGWVAGELLINIHSYPDGTRQTGMFHQKDLGDWTPKVTAYAITYFR